MVADEASTAQYADILDGHGEIDEWKRIDFNVLTPRSGRFISADGGPRTAIRATARFRPLWPGDCPAGGE